MRGILVWMILIIILVCGEALGVDLKGQMKESSPVPEGLKKEMKEAPPIPEGFKKGKSDLSIERIYLRDCKVFVVIKNRGTGGVSSEDYKSGKLLVQLNWRVPRGGGEVREFLLSQVDRYGNLRRSGGEVDFDTEITLGATEIYHVRAELLNLRDDADRGQKRLFQDLTLSKECVSRPKTPETRKPPTAGFPSPPQIEKPFKEKPFPERDLQIDKRFSEGMKRQIQISNGSALGTLEDKKSKLEREVLKKEVVKTTQTIQAAGPKLYINNINAPVIFWKGAAQSDLTPLNISWTVMSNVTATVLTISYIDANGNEIKKLGEIVRDEGLPSNYSIKIRDLFIYLKQTMNENPVPFKVYRFKFTLKYERERRKSGMEKAAEIRYETHPGVQRAKQATSQEQSSGMRMVTPSMQGLEGLVEQFEERTNPLQIKLVYQVIGDPNSFDPQEYFQANSSAPVYTLPILWVTNDGRLDGSLEPIEELLDKHGVQSEYDPCYGAYTYGDSIHLASKFFLDEISSTGLRKIEMPDIFPFNRLIKIYCMGHVGEERTICTIHHSDLTDLSTLAQWRGFADFDTFIRQEYGDYIKPGNTYVIRGEIVIYKVYNKGSGDPLFTVIQVPTVIYTVFAPGEKEGVKFTTGSPSEFGKIRVVSSADCPASSNENISIPPPVISNFGGCFTWGQQIPLEIVPTPASVLNVRISIYKWQDTSLQWEREPFMITYAKVGGGNNIIRILQDTDSWKKFLDPGTYKLECWFIGENYINPCGTVYVKVERGREQSFTPGGKRRFDMQIIRADEHKGHGIKLKIRIVEGNPITGEFIKSVPVFIEHEGNTIWKIDIPAPITPQWKEIILPSEVDIPPSGQVRVRAYIPESEYWYGASTNNYLDVPKDKLSNYSIISVNYENIGDILLIRGSVKGDIRGSFEKSPSCPNIRVEFYTGQWEKKVYEINNYICDYISAICNNIYLEPGMKSVTRCYLPYESETPFSFTIKKKELLEASGEKRQLKMRVYVQEYYNERNKDDNYRLFDIYF